MLIKKHDKSRIVELIRAAFGVSREISVCVGLRGGAGRTRTSNQMVMSVPSSRQLGPSYFSERRGVRGNVISRGGSLGGWLMRAPATSLGHSDSR
jgi:hypothetical protein